MTKKVESRISIRPTDKNKVYLETLGFLDRRTGRKRNSVLNINEFLNEVLTIALETGMHHKKLNASPEDLMASWRKHQVSMRNREIGRLNQEISSIVNWKG